MNLQVKKYKGDQSLRKALDTAGCNVPLEYLKAAMLGAQSSDRNVSMDTLMSDVFKNDTITNNTNPDLIALLQGLWYHLFGLRQFPKSEDFTLRNNEIIDKEAVISFVQLHVVAGRNYIRYLPVGDAGRGKGERYDKLYTIFGSNLGLLESLLYNMSEKWDKNEFENGDAFYEKLGRFIRVLWDTMVAIKETVKQKNLELLKNRDIIKRIEIQIGKSIGRNEPCPCGSGKKTKHCCGRL